MKSSLADCSLLTLWLKQVLFPIIASFFRFWRVILEHIVRAINFWNYFSLSEEFKFTINFWKSTFMLPSHKCSWKYYMASGAQGECPCFSNLGFLFQDLGFSLVKIACRTVLTLPDVWFLSFWDLQASIGRRPVKPKPFLLNLIMYDKESSLLNMFSDFRRSCNFQLKELPKMYMWTYS